MLKQPGCRLTFSNGERISDPCCDVEVAEWLMRQESSARSDATAQIDLTPTDLLAHLRHLRPTSLSAHVKGLLVLLGCSLFAAELLLAEPDRRWLAGS